MRLVAQEMTQPTSQVLLDHGLTPLLRVQAMTTLERAIEGLFCNLRGKALARTAGLVPRFPFERTEGTEGSEALVT